MASLGPALTALLAIATALGVDRLCARRGLTPPGFTGLRTGLTESNLRRSGALLLLAGVLWLGVFLPLAVPAAEDLDLSTTPRATIFLLHAAFALYLLFWYGLGFVGLAGPGHQPSARLTAQLGMRLGSLRRLLVDLGLGIGAGFAAWGAFFVVVLTAALSLAVLGWEDLLPRTPPPMISWIVSLPIWLRLAVSLSAGFFEEAFFRGYLQPRIGIALSTGLFVLAHAGYGQPFMLLGVTVLSLCFAFLVRWRGNIWSAVAAHALFDAVQLLIVLPHALEMLKAS